MPEPFALFQTIVDDHRDDPAVRQARMFGAHSLLVNDKGFAMFYKDQFVVKLPRERIDALIAAGQAAPFDPGYGRIMGGWAVLETLSEEECRRLANEAKAYVREEAASGKSGKSKRKKQA